MKEKVKKVVLAYSGGLDTSVIVRWLVDTYGCEVVGFVADVGQEEELTGLKEKGVNSGASKVIIEDLREEFVRDFVFPMLRANAVYEGSYLMGTSIARPLIAKRQVEIAAAEGAILVDQYSILKNRPDYYDPDCVHPNTAGEIALAGNWLRALRASLDFYLRGERPNGRS